jgi:hypothetical protein
MCCVAPLSQSYACDSKCGKRVPQKGAVLPIAGAPPLFRHEALGIN